MARQDDFSRIGTIISVADPKAVEIANKLKTYEFLKVEGYLVPQFYVHSVQDLLMAAKLWDIHQNRYKQKLLIIVAAVESELLTLNVIDIRFLHMRNQTASSPRMMIC